jgi:hypothetical protein
MSTAKVYRSACRSRLRTRIRPRRELRSTALVSGVNRATAGKDSSTHQRSERAIHSRASDWGGSGGAFESVPPDMKNECAPDSLRRRATWGVRGVRSSRYPPTLKPLTANAFA